MLRSSLVRVGSRNFRALAARRRAQLLESHQSLPFSVLSRVYADKKPDEPTSAASKPPVPSSLATTSASSQDVSKSSPTSNTVKLAATTPAGTDTNATTPPPPSPPKPPRRLVRFLVNLIILTVLGYGIAVYYALTSDNWHDFFTEYVPFGEEVVAYFEEQEFKKRISKTKPQQESRLHPQVRGEAKVTIPGRAGATVKNIEEGSDLGAKGKHSSAVDSPDAKKEDTLHPQTAAVHTQERTPEKAATREVVKPDTKEEPKAEKPAAPTPPELVKAEPAKLIDNINIENSNEPIVQDLVKILNDIIIVINADNASGKYGSTIDKAKGDLSKIINDIGSIREQEKKNIDEKISNLHSEFDNAARELIRRTEQEMKDMEMRWMEEYENERGNLSQAYDEKLRSELASASQVYDQRLKNELLKQAIKLRREFSDSVKQTVESEREGRLSKLDELSSSVSELEKLTGEWNSVVDSTLSTQHLLVAVEAVRAVLENTDKPKPFVEELAALKEVASENEVVNAAIASINPAAYQRGISTPAQLVDRFRRVATEVRKAALLPENAGVASIAASYVLSKVLFKKEGLPVGDDVESILTRTEVLLEEGNLEDAVREMNSLQGWAKVLSGDWLNDCRRVLEVQQALDVISTEARLRSLLVD